MTTIAADYDPLAMSEENDQENAEETEPAEVVFSVLRKDEETPIGPYTQEDILLLLQSGQLHTDDQVYYEGMESWEPINQVFEVQQQISHFVDNGQDRTKVAEAFEEISEVLASGEDIYYIAIQERTGLLHKNKVTVIPTNKRLLLLHEKRHGYELESQRWESISNTLMKDEGKGLATFSVLLQMEKRIDIPHLPIAQVQQLFKLSQELRDLNPEAF